MKPIVSPSLLSCDFANIESECKMVNESEAGWFHLDIMDGIFVPNITFGIPVVGSISRYAEKPLDVHLMIMQPERFIEEFYKAGAGILSVHYEASTHLHRTIQAIKAGGMQAGVALNPHTNVNVLEDTISEIDLVVIMSVNPGFGGQKFIGNTFAKVEQTKNLIQQKNSSAKIEVDGGVTSENARQLVECGADVLVAGSFVFRSENPKQTISDLKNCVSDKV